MEPGGLGGAGGKAWLVWDRSWASGWTEGSGTSPLPVSSSQVSQAWGLRSSPPRLHVPGPRGVFPSGASGSVFGSAQCTCGTLRALWPSSSSLFLVDAEAPNKPEWSPHPAPAHVWALRGSCRGSQGGRVAGALVLRSTGKCHSPSPSASSPDPPERSTPLTHFRLPPPEEREDAGWCFQRLCLCRFVTVAERNECSVGTHPGLTGELLGQGQSQAPYP